MFAWAVPAESLTSAAACWPQPGRSRPLFGARGDRLGGVLGCLLEVLHRLLDGRLDRVHQGLGLVLGGGGEPGLAVSRGHEGSDKPPCPEGDEPHRQGVALGAGLDLPGNGGCLVLQT